MRASQLRTYAPQTLAAVTETLQILDQTGEFEMIDNYAIFLIKESESKLDIAALAIIVLLIEQKEFLKEVLIPLAKQLKKEASVTLGNSRWLHYLINYSEFKEVVSVIIFLDLDWQRAGMFE